MQIAFLGHFYVEAFLFIFHIPLKNQMSQNDIDIGAVFFFFFFFLLGKNVFWAGTL
jgi:hypothetical protein